MILPLSPLGPKIDARNDRYKLKLITTLDPKFGENARKDGYNTTLFKSRPVLQSAPLYLNRVP